MRLLFLVLLSSALFTYGTVAAPGSWYSILPFPYPYSTSLWTTTTSDLTSSSALVSATTVHRPSNTPMKDPVTTFTSLVDSKSPAPIPLIQTVWIWVPTPTPTNAAGNAGALLTLTGTYPTYYAFTGPFQTWTKTVFKQPFGLDSAYISSGAHPGPTAPITRPAIPTVTEARADVRYPDLQPSYDPAANPSQTWHCDVDGDREFRLLVYLVGGAGPFRNYRVFSTGGLTS
ncbi:hypothetical protein BDW74DRAFT_179292 [Aspergillus multicolor]|uniref:uncharacterized protein n=1 Tax=Aspergillus multicolor TaxID=41759 RepID=UPI003CCDE9DA